MRALSYLPASRTDILSTPRTVSVPRSLPPSTPPNWLSALPKSYLYTGQGASCLGDGQLLKARILVNFTFLFPECLVQRRASYNEFKQHVFRKGLGSESFLPPDRWVDLQSSPSAQHFVIKGHQRGRLHRFLIISDLATFLHHSHLVHRNFGGFILADGIYYKCELEEKNMKFYTLSLLL